MGRVCREAQDWVETQIERPIETWENQQETRCRNEPCNWWTLCLNVLFCWVAWVLVKIVRIVLVTVGKWVARVVCEVVNFVLDAAAFVVNLILSIPIIGGILRTILNWVTEIFWRLVGLPDFFLSLAGVRLRKKMYVGAILPPNMTTTPAITTADVMRQIDSLVAFYDSTCNIDVIFTGLCTPRTAAPNEALVVGCDAGGFFNDWWLAGSWMQFVMSACKFTDGARRVAGYGGEIVVFIVDDVTPAGTNGCSFASTHDWVVVEAKPADQAFVAAHEVGHACWLPHDGNAANLMFSSTPAAGPVLTNLQIATVRGSKHCVFI